MSAQHGRNEKSMTNSTFALGIELDGDGAHPAAWRHARHAPDTLLAPGRYAEIGARAEEAGFTFATFRDSSPSDGLPNIAGRLDTVEVAAYVAAATNRLGLVPAVNTIHAEPFHLANQLGSLDWASNGRSGWLAEARETPAVAAAYGAEPVLDAQAIQREAGEVVAANRRLWDTWEDGIFIADDQTPRFMDLEKFQYADFDGEFFAVKGPSIVPRPPQGHPVVFGRPGQLATERPDVVLVSGSTLDAVASEAARQRQRGIPKVVLDLEVVLDTESGTARDRLAELDAGTGWPARTGVFRHAGGVEGLVALLQDLAGAVDGVRILPAVLDVELDVIGRAVLPELERAGIFTRPAAGRTLRESFGLARPRSVFAAARQPSARHNDRRTA
jgi:alkanesulfonate monooxygenase SsuD/methylene tetrahydromethanopterin reductase-like flavin-dependent oxidoreductase (luciferase family)